jgi:hypothetical protein
MTVIMILEMVHYVHVEDGDGIFQNEENERRLTKKRNRTESYGETSTRAD